MTHKQRGCLGALLEWLGGASSGRRAIVPVENAALLCVRCDLDRPVIKGRMSREKSTALRIADAACIAGVFANYAFERRPSRDDKLIADGEHWALTGDERRECGDGSLFDSAHPLAIALPAEAPHRPTFGRAGHFAAPMFNGACLLRLRV